MLNVILFFGFVVFFPLLSFIPSYTYTMSHSWMLIVNTGSPIHKQRWNSYTHMTYNAYRIENVCQNKNKRTQAYMNALDRYEIQPHTHTHTHTHEQSDRLWNDAV